MAVYVTPLPTNGGPAGPASRRASEGQQTHLWVPRCGTSFGSNLQNKKLDIGFKTSTYELAQFYLLCPESGKMCGIWVSHVDVLLLAFGGESKFAQGIRATFKQEFTFGRWSVQDIVCCGRHFNQDDKLWQTST